MFARNGNAKGVMGTRWLLHIYPSANSLVIKPSNFVTDGRAYSARLRMSASQIRTTTKLFLERTLRKMKKLLLLLALVSMVVFASSAFTVSANGDCDFTLFGTAQPDTDPQNPSNEVVRSTQTIQTPLTTSVVLAKACRPALKPRR